MDWIRRTAIVSTARDKVMKQIAQPAGLGRTDELNSGARIAAILLFDNAGWMTGPSVQMAGGCR